jgi:hypothetical protein
MSALIFTATIFGGCQNASQRTMGLNSSGSTPQLPGGSHNSGSGYAPTTGPSSGTPSAPQSTTQTSGGVDGSGGDTFKSSEDQVRKTLSRVKDNMRVVFFRIEYFWKDTHEFELPPGRRDSMSPSPGIHIELIFPKLKEGLHTHESFEQTIDRLRFYFVDHGCHAKPVDPNVPKKNNPGEGSKNIDDDVVIDKEAAAKPDGEICLNMTGLRQVAPEALEIELNALVFHEIAHVRGLNTDRKIEEQQAVQLQTWFVENQHTFLRQDYDQECNCYKEKAFEDLQNKFIPLHLKTSAIILAAYRRDFQTNEVCQAYEATKFADLDILGEISPLGVSDSKPGLKITLPPSAKEFSDSDIFHTTVDSDWKVIESFCSLTGSTGAIDQYVHDLQGFEERVLTRALEVDKKLHEMESRIAVFRHNGSGPKLGYETILAIYRMQALAELTYFEDAKTRNWSDFPKTNLSDVTCDVRNTKAISPLRLHLITVEQQPSIKDFGAHYGAKPTIAMASFQLPFYNGETETFHLFFSQSPEGKVDIHNTPSHLLRIDMKPEYDLNDKGNVNSGLTTSHEINFVDDGFEGVAVLQTAELNYFKFTVQFHRQSANRSELLTTDQYEIRCSLFPLNETEFKQHPLL